MATSPELLPPEITPNEADLNEITGDDTTELTTSAPLNSSSVPVADMVFFEALCNPIRNWQYSKSVGSPRPVAIGRVNRVFRLYASSSPMARRLYQQSSVMRVTRRSSPTDPSSGFGPRFIYQGITSEFTVTIPGNFRKHLERGIELKDLPQTFRDAVEVARELKVRYLWIDALCIIQKEADHKDWKRECGNMASIYRNSYVTIAAAWANSANSGCFITPDPGVTIGPVMMRDMYHSPFKPTPEDLTNFPIFTRAWTFQERLLARRVIYFGRQEIVWDCITKRACECGGVADWWQSLTKLEFHNQATRESIGGLWRLESLRLEWYPDRAYELEEMAVIYLIPMMTSLGLGDRDFHGLVVKRYGQGREMTRVGLATRKEEESDKLDFSFLHCEKQVIKIV
ncbi:HET domain-containing protein [Fusarium sp. Ph1]|nr:HET domain-containing protein [Fusarium sp. Ph1]